MYRALPVSRRTFKGPPGLVRAARRRGTRTFSSSLPLANDVASSSTSTPPPKRRGFFRTLTLYSTGFLVLFYATSPVVAFNNERYHAFFVESVPFGERIINFAEDNGLDDKLRISIPAFGTDALKKIYDSVSRSVPKSEEKPRETVQEKVAAAKKTASEKVEQAKEKAKETKERVKEVTESLKTKTENAVAGAAQATAGAVSSVTRKAPTKPKEKKVEEAKGAARPTSFSEGVEDLVKQAEAALTGKPVDRLPEATTPAAQLAASPLDLGPKDNQAAEVAPSDVLPQTSASDRKVYPDLPVGFEPPPGFVRPKGPEPTPAPSKSKDGAETDAALPKVATAVADIGSSEPVLAELASTIDSLAAFLKDNPSAASTAKPILDTAQVDLKELAARIEQVRREEHDKLEAELDQQAREYSMKLLETELTAQDKLDEQELEFKQFFEEEQRKAIQEYRAKLDEELRAQSEIINERLKQEVIAQGIEMQRRWIRDIKVRVEQERGGRLGRLDELAANLKKLERLTLDNAEYLDANLRLHAMWAAIRAVTAASTESPERKPFRDELRVLRHASAAQEDELVSTILDALERTDVPDIGVEPLADLTTWFTTSVAPQVARVALVPEQDAGVLSYLTSHLISGFRFARHGLVEGDDVLSVLSRAEYYLNEKDLDNAARELNQLKGAPKALLSDWLEAARRRLEVLQALEVIRAEATRASLLVV